MIDDSGNTTEAVPLVSTWKEKMGNSFKNFQRIQNIYLYSEGSSHHIDDSDN